MTLKKILMTGAAAAVSLAALPVAAQTLLFELTGTRNATFTLNPTVTAPTTFSSTSIGDQALFNAVSGTFGGVPGAATIGFGNGLVADLNIQSPNLGFTQLTGPDFFSLVNSRPTFQLGTFALNGIVSGRNTLTISAATSAVPEPASWAMMVGGIGIVGGGLRRQRKIAATVSFA